MDSQARQKWRPAFIWGFLRVAAGIWLLFMILNLGFPLPSPAGYSTMVLDRDGELLHAYLSPDDKWRMKTTIDEVTPLLRKALLTKEDKYFYYHPGVNPLAVGRALVRNIFTGRTTSGASTITMQVARLLEPRSRTIPTKMIEMFRALQLEYAYSKDEILQLYLNLVPYGGNIEGIKSASWIFLQKNPDHLSLAEITALAVIPNRPNSLRPGRHNAAIVEARNQWLHRFAQWGSFDSLTIADALEEPFDVQRNPVPRLAPHLSRRLGRSGQSAITTTLHRQTQQVADKLVADYVQGLRMLNIRNAAVMVINNQTHEVEAYTGSASFADTTDAGQVDGITAIRQPGSTLKPLLYGMCIDEGLVTPRMMVTDVATNYGGYAPENYDQRFNGLVSMEYALEHSLNIPAVRMLHQLGKNRLIDALQSAGFRRVAKDRGKLGLSLILGGCGTTLEELTGLFSAFANEGVYHPPIFTLPFQSSLPNKSDIRHQTSDIPQSSTRLLTPAASYIITDILSHIQRPDFPLNWSATEKLPRIAWKTGTSYGRRDAWSIGYNKQYTVGVWVGNFSGQGIPELSGATMATPLLFRIFNAIDYDNDKDWFAQPAQCDLRIVCSESGLPPAEGCENRVTDFFIPSVSPSRTCNLWQEYLVSPDQKMSYCQQCAPDQGYMRRKYYDPGPEVLAHLRSSGKNPGAIPPHNPECVVIFAGNRPRIQSPSPSAVYYISRQHPEPILLQCQAGGDAHRVYWYINDRFYKTASPGEKLFYLPAAGPLKIACTDDKGRKDQVRCMVELVDL